MSEKTDQTTSNLESPFLAGEVVQPEFREKIESGVDTLAGANPFDWFRSTRYESFSPEQESHVGDAAETLFSTEPDSTEQFSSDETEDDWEAFHREAEVAFTPGATAIEPMPAESFEAYENRDNSEPSYAAPESYEAADSFTGYDEAASENEYATDAVDEWSNWSGNSEEQETTSEESGDPDTTGEDIGWETQDQYEEHELNRDYEEIEQAAPGQTELVNTYTDEEFSTDPYSYHEVDYGTNEVEDEQPKKSSSPGDKDLLTVTVMLDEPVDSDDEFQLESSDGSPKKILSAAAAKPLVTGEKVLKFEGVKATPTGTFKLLHKRSRFATPRTVFLGRRFQDLTAPGGRPISAKNVYLTLPSQVSTKLPDRYRVDRDVDKDLIEAAPVLVDLVVEDPLI